MYRDELITLKQAARLLPKVDGHYRDYKTIAQWCERADLVAVWGPKMVYKSEFLAWASRVGKLPPATISA